VRSVVAGHRVVLGAMLARAVRTQRPHLTRRAIGKNGVLCGDWDGRSQSERKKATDALVVGDWVRGDESQLCE